MILTILHIHAFKCDSTVLPCVDAPRTLHVERASIFAAQLQLGYECGLGCSVGDDDVE